MKINLVNENINEKVNHLKENHIDLPTEVLDLMDFLETKYERLVWYSRKPVTGGPGLITDEDIKPMYQHIDSKPTQETIDSIKESVRETYEHFPIEVQELHGLIDLGDGRVGQERSVGDWRHGFNSGMLGCLRMLSQITHFDNEYRKSVNVQYPNLDS